MSRTNATSAEGDKTPYGLRFIASPPYFHFRTDYGRKIPNPPYATAPIWKHSIYYYWWAYLRCNEQYAEACRLRGRVPGPISKLYRDFGDVHDLKFKEWWQQQGHYLFAEPPSEIPVQLVQGSSVYQLPKTVLVRIPLQQRFQVTVRQLRELLGKRIIEEKGEGQARRSAPSRALYPVTRKFTLRSLENYLAAWTAVRRNPKATLSQLADALEVKGPASFSPSSPQYKVAQTNEMSRRVRLADNLIFHVGRGEFPRIDDKTKFLPEKWGST